MQAAVLGEHGVEVRDLPKPVPQPGFWIMPAALVVGIAVAVLVHRWAKRRQERKRRQEQNRATQTERAAAATPSSPGNTPAQEEGTGWLASLRRWWSDVLKQARKK